METRPWQGASLPQVAGGWQGVRVSKGRKCVPVREDPGPDSGLIHLGPSENHRKLKETRLCGAMLMIYSRTIWKGSSRGATAHTETWLVCTEMCSKYKIHTES